MKKPGFHFVTPCRPAPLLNTNQLYCDIEDDISFLIPKKNDSLQLGRIGAKAIAGAFSNVQ